MEGVADERLDGLGVDLGVLGVLIVGVVEAESALLDVFSEVHLLPACSRCYLYSLTTTYPALPTLTISVYPR